MATTLTVNLRKKLVSIHTTRRRKQAMRYLRAEVAKHTGVEQDSVSIGMDVNEYMIRNTAIHMRPVLLNVDKTAGKVKVTLADALKNWRRTKAPAAAQPAKAAVPAANAAKPAAQKPATKQEAPKPAQPKKQEAKKGDKKPEQKPQQKGKEQV